MTDHFIDYRIQDLVAWENLGQVQTEVDMEVEVEVECLIRKQDEERWFKVSKTQGGVNQQT